MNLGVCRSCGAPIRWAVTKATGANLPLEPEPCPDGNVLVLPATAEGAPDLCEVLGRAAREAHTGPLYLSHFVGCPFAAAHRRAKGG